MATLPFDPQGAGIPGQWTETITVTEKALVTGDTPSLVTRDHIVAASQTLSAFHVVGVDASGRIVPAISADATSRAIGIMVVAVTTDGTTNYKGAPVYRQGVVNPDALVWPASYDTDAKKFAAFDGAPTPTDIIVRRPKTMSL